MNFQDISEFLDLIKNPAKYEKYLTELKDAKDQLQAAAELVGKANEIEKLQIKTTKLVEKAEAKAAARAPRRITLGTQAFPVGAAIGADAGKRIDVNLDAPVVVEPGTFLHVILKMPVGTATASQIIRGVVGINAYWE